MGAKEFWARTVGETTEASTSNDLRSGAPFPFEFSRGNWVKVDRTAILAMYGLLDFDRTAAARVKQSDGSEKVIIPTRLEMMRRKNPQAAKEMEAKVEKMLARAHEYAAEFAKRNPKRFEFSETDPASAPNPVVAAVDAVKEVMKERVLPKFKRTG